MDNFILTIQEIISPLVNTSSLLVIFVVFTVVCLIIGMGIFASLRNGLLIAAGFQGIYIVVEFFLNTIGPVSLALGERFGGNFTYTDLGWATFSAYAWGHPIAYAVVAISIAVNLVMIILNLTDTINLNIWDTWHTTISALIVLALTQNIAAALIVSAGLSCLALFFTDWFANRGYIADFFQISNMSFYQGVNVWWTMFGEVVAKLLDKLPFTASEKFTPEEVQKRYGMIGEPSVLGGIIGCLMGIGAGMLWTDIILLMIQLSACLLLMPMMTGIVVQALIPVSEAANAFTTKLTKGKKVIYIGLDPAVAVGNPTAMAVATLMIPVVLLLAFIIPGTNYIPLADLSALVFVIVYFVAQNKGDLVRTLITSILAAIIATVAGIFIAPLANLVAMDQGATSGATSMFLSYDDEILLSGLLGKQFPTLGVVGIAIVMAIIVGIGVFFRIRFNKSRAAAVADAAAE